ncbi:8-amino-7-oxononanoate synthase [Vitis vinifera]|uniref:8-amino-7-oxononanoate synthase n=1 Tax=Vitis vinifera TaxID=29760 RepID=A0A438D4U8_VITVI|nr:8-amino-7-oxononanoate synthase [Vitis vinifera]
MNRWSNVLVGRLRFGFSGVIGDEAACGDGLDDEKVGVSHQKSRDLLLFSGNDYLGLSSHPTIGKAAAKAAREHGMGPRGSALVCGYTNYHRLLESCLADLKKKEDCLLCPTGFAANMALMVALGSVSSLLSADQKPLKDERVAIFSDALNHASIIDGIRLAERQGSAEIFVYRHCDMPHLNELLSSCTLEKKVVVTDRRLGKWIETWKQTLRPECLLLDSKISFLFLRILGTQMRHHGNMRKSYKEKKWYNGEVIQDIQCFKGLKCGHGLISCLKFWRIIILSLSLLHSIPVWIGCNYPKILSSYGNMSLFSMDGDFAPMAELAKLRKKHGFLLVIDDAHGTFVCGKNGGGVAEEFNCESDVDICVGTLSKAAGCHGGFIACSKRWKQLILSRGRSFIFSTAMPVPVVAATLASYALNRLTATVYDMTVASAFIVACFLLLTNNYDLAAAVIVAKRRNGAELQSGTEHLLKSGFHVTAIRPPTVPPNSCRLRVTLTSVHTTEDVKKLTVALSDCIGLTQIRVYSSSGYARL